MYSISEGWYGSGFMISAVLRMASANHFFSDASRDFNDCNTRLNCLISSLYWPISVRIPCCSK